MLVSRVGCMLAESESLVLVNWSHLFTELKLLPC